jgi:predicted transcriptional regulator
LSEEVSKTALTAEIVANYVANNTVPIDELPTLIRTISDTLESLDKPDAGLAGELPKPTASQIKKSIRPDALISFIDGKPYKTLKRHLTGHGLTVDAYKEKFGLPSTYPTTAPNYSAQRSQMAKSLGLGNKRAAEPVETPKPRGRPKKSVEA